MIKLKEERTKNLEGENTKSIFGSDFSWEPYKSLDPFVRCSIVTNFEQRQLACAGACVELQHLLLLVLHEKWFVFNAYRHLSQLKFIWFIFFGKIEFKFLCFFWPESFHRRTYEKSSLPGLRTLNHRLERKFFGTRVC